MYNILFIVLGLSLALVLGILSYQTILPPLVGGYWRKLPAVGGSMYFLTKRGAQRYGQRGPSSIDPYARRIGPIAFQPGILLRRSKTN